MSNVLQDKAARPSGLVSLERLMVSNCWTNDNNERHAMHLTDIISIEYVSTQWLGNQLSLPIEYVSTVGMLVLQ